MKSYKLPKNFLKKTSIEAEKVSGQINNKNLKPPKYSSKDYSKNLTENKYFDALITIRHYIKIATDIYFGEIIGAKNVDLFMLTPSISSPMGPGSDSEAIPIKFGNLDTFLVDSSQFGFEPLLFQNLDKVYCYLPSMRGEDPDSRHLNQFFHSEAEIVGTLKDLTPIVEGYVRALSDTLLAMEPLVSSMSVDYSKTKQALEKISTSKSFQVIPFGDAFQNLQNVKSKKQLIEVTKFGRQITSEGEKELMKKLSIDKPLWMSGFDRKTVPFYQKPNPDNQKIVINADLLFPPLTAKGFGGEILGSGQRQDCEKELIESMKQQGINKYPYQWYINLRNLPNYRTTSGFGLGIERFLAWSLGYEDIKDVILYPRLKNVKTIP
jgi:asparaginyl-tRNA synthetase